ncbi:MAG TPA: hypothetical protein VH442_21225 [Micromonosporaceae bacterium]|jgi:hypothetical protein
MVRPRWGRVVTVFVVLAAAAGCGTVAAAGGSNGNQEFVDDIAAQLSGASTQAYTAVYALGRGATGTVAQEPTTERSSYTYPDGVTVVTSDGATVCHTAGSRPTGPCTRYSSVDAAAPDIARGGLIRTESVITMLSSAATDRDAIVSEQDTTIAGTSATCITVTSGAENTDQYKVCVIADGLLGSFHGTWDGATIDVMMVSFRKSVSADAFRLPSGATVSSPTPSAASPGTTPASPGSTPPSSSG